MDNIEDTPMATLEVAGDGGSWIKAQIHRVLGTSNRDHVALWYNGDNKWFGLDLHYTCVDGELKDAEGVIIEYKASNLTLTLTLALALTRALTLTLIQQP